MKYNYTGSSLNKTMQMSYEDHGWSVCVGQDGAIYGDCLFRFGNSSDCTVYSMSQKKQIGSFIMDKRDGFVTHNNAVCFGSEKADENDEFPLLYTNIYNNYSGSKYTSSYYRDGKEDKREGILCVYRITRKDNIFNAELKQIIQIGFVNNTDYWKSSENDDVMPYGNFAIDTKNNKLYAFLMRDKEMTTRYFEFDLPKLNDGVPDDYCGCKLVTLKVEDIKARFDCEYSNFLQGACFHDGKIYSVEGGHHDPELPARMQIIDTVTQKKFAEIDLYGIGLTAEPEMVEYYDGALYYIDGDGEVMTFTFY